MPWMKTAPIAPRIRLNSLEQATELALKPSRNYPVVFILPAAGVSRVH